jgi:hypothetical protein
MGRGETPGPERQSVFFVAAWRKHCEPTVTVTSVAAAG